VAARTPPDLIHPERAEKPSSSRVTIERRISPRSMREFHSAMLAAWPACMRTYAD